MRLGIDDTDGPDGGCTTHLLTEVIGLARARGLDVLGAPSLVRLNPNVPWKTRGNAALSVELGHGRGPRRTIGSMHGAPVVSFARGRPASRAEAENFRSAAWDLVRSRSEDDPRTDPALVVAEGRLPTTLYERAVSDLVAPADVRTALRAARVWFRCAGSGQGIVGAAAAVAWPGERHTWEAIAYRPDGVHGPRRVDPVSVRRAARRDPRVFLCDDPRTRRILVAPHTNCPVLFGIRATSAAAAVRALASVRSGPVDRWFVFRTNQGTGDHLRVPAVLPLRPYRPARLRGSVFGLPSVGPGGHVGLELEVAGRRVDCVAFEPTKTLPRVARELRPGDVVEVWGGTGEDPALRLEGIRVLRLAPRVGPPRPPECPTCERRAGSLGRGRGYRCPQCRRRFPPEAARPRSVRPRVRVGTYHPTPSARRHLAPRPLPTR